MHTTAADGVGSTLRRCSTPTPEVPMSESENDYEFETLPDPENDDEIGTNDLDDNDSESIVRNVNIIRLSELSPAESKAMRDKAHRTNRADWAEARGEMEVRRQGGVISSFNRLFEKMDEESIETHFQSIRDWLDIELGLDWKMTVLRTVERMERQGVDSITAERRVLLGLSSIIADSTPEELEDLQNSVRLARDLQKVLGGAEDTALN
jgi:hypothetical protein